MPTILSLDSPKNANSGISLTEKNATLAVHNPITFSFSSYPSFLPAVKSNGTLFFDVNKDLTAGTKIIFNGVEILVSDTPNANQIPAVDRTRSNTNNSYPQYYPPTTANTAIAKYKYVIFRLITILSNNPTLSTLYQFVPNEKLADAIVPIPAYYNIYITAKFAGSAFNPTFSIIPAPSPLPYPQYDTIPPTIPPISTPLQSPSFNGLNNGQDANTAMSLDELAVFFDVYISPNSTYNNFQQSTTNYTTDIKTIRLIKYFSDDYLEFDVSKILKSFTSPSIFNPDGQIFQSANEMAIRYYIRYGFTYKFNDSINEEYVNNFGLWDNNVFAQRQYWAVESSLPLQYDGNKLNDTFAQYYRGIPTKFLTKQPLEKIITTYQDEYLYFILARDVNSILNIQRRFDIKFEDGTTTQYLPNVLFPVVTYGEIFKFKLLSYLELKSLEVINNKRIKSYEISLVNVLTPTIKMSETLKYTYHYDNQCQDVTGQLHFINDLGGFSTVQINGAIKYKLKSDRVTYERNNLLTYQYNQLAFTPFDESKSDSKHLLNVNTTYTVECSTGYLPADHLEWLKQVVNSKEMYFRDDNSLDGWADNQMRECSLINFTYEKDVNTDWYSFTFELEFGIQLNERV